MPLYLPSVYIHNYICKEIKSIWSSINFDLLLLVLLWVQNSLKYFFRIALNDFQVFYSPFPQTDEMLLNSEREKLQKKL